MSAEASTTKPSTVVSKATPAAAPAVTATETKPEPAASAPIAPKASAPAIVAPPQAEAPKVAEKKAPEVAAAPKVDVLQPLLKELASTEPARRAKAAVALGRTADAAAAPALIAALRDGDADVAREAAASLGLLRSPTAVEPLIAVLNNRDGFFHAVVRIAATHSLGRLGDNRAVEPLIHAVRDPIAEASAEAIRALAALSDPRSLPAFLQVIRNENGYFLSTTRHAAIVALAKIGGEQAVCELKFVAGNEWEDATIRAAAIEATREGTAKKA